MQILFMFTWKLWTRAPEWTIVRGVRSPEVTTLTLDGPHRSSDRATLAIALPAKRIPPDVFLAEAELGRVVA
jgi:hypothetical protein